MSNAEQWLELAEALTFETTNEANTVETITTTETADHTEATLATIDPAPHDPRICRVLSISQLRQKLGIENTAPANPAPQPSADRPRIVRRRLGALQEAELLAG